MKFSFLYTIPGSLCIRSIAFSRLIWVIAPLAIGLCLTLIHLIGIPVTNTSVNPARSLATTAVVCGWAVEQLWLFITAPILGAVVAGLAYEGFKRK